MTKLRCQSLFLYFGRSRSFVAHGAGANELGTRFYAEFAHMHLAMENRRGFEEVANLHFAIELASDFGTCTFDGALYAASLPQNQLALRLDVAFNNAIDAQIAVGLYVADKFSSRTYDVGQFVFYLEILTHSYCHVLIIVLWQFFAAHLDFYAVVRP